MKKLLILVLVLGLFGCNKTEIEIEDIPEETETLNYSGCSITFNQTGDVISMIPLWLVIYLTLGCMLEKLLLSVKTILIKKKTPIWWRFSYLKSSMILRLLVLYPISINLKAAMIKIASSNDSNLIDFNFLR